MEINSLLQPFQHFGVNLGLSRIVKLLANLGNPHHQVPIIHVAGSNGKGSVCAYLSSILTEAGYRTGRYTSPHLVHWRERICLNEQAIYPEELADLLTEVKGAILPGDDCPTQFEVITAAAWLYFARQRVDIAVVEVGLGGRLDATNVCEYPLVSIITSISREHWQQLGPTVADIAREKAGILKVGCPAVVGNLPADAAKVVLSKIEELQCPYIMPKPGSLIAPGWAEYQGGKYLRVIKYPLPLSGQIQLHNSALALAAVEVLQQGGWNISQGAVVDGMGKTQWLGRMQWVNWHHHKLLIDGAHNPAAAEVLRHYVDSLHPDGLTWVMGMLSTKEHGDIFRALLRPHDRLYLVPVPDHSSANPKELAKLAQGICPELKLCQAQTDLSSALAAACDGCHQLVVLCGSLYLIGHFLGQLSDYSTLE